MISLTSNCFIPEHFSFSPFGEIMLADTYNKYIHFAYFFPHIKNVKVCWILVDKISVDILEIFSDRISVNPKIVKTELMKDVFFGPKLLKIIDLMHNALLL